MKPLKLEFKGINSFSEHTVIDFEALTKNGLFGIFGDTGSGKSTILDCINFALYGSVERSREKTDIINYRCSAAEVKFVFNILNSGKRKTYTVYRTIKKDKSGTHKASLYEEADGNEVCIADKPSAVEEKIVEILGVGDEDFRKCIALPQGEFSRFVKSAPRERLTLIERLFSLSRYGDRLKEKLTIRQNALENEFQNAAGRLSAYEGVSDEALKEMDDRLTALEKSREDAAKSAQEINDNYEKTKNLYEKLAELRQAEKRAAELDAQKEKMLRLQSGLKSLPLCREAVACADEIEQKKAQIQNLSAGIERLKNSLADIEKLSAELEKELQSGEIDGKIDECIRLAAAYKTCEGKPEKLKTLMDGLDKKREEYRQKDGERAKLYERQTEAAGDIAKLEAEIESLRGADLEHILKVNFKAAILKDEYVKNLDYFSELGAGINVYKDDSPLYRYVGGEVRRKIEEYKRDILEIKDFGFAKVEGQLKELREADDRREKLQNALNNARDNLHKITTAAEVKEAELKTVKKDGEELRARAAELENELKQVFGETRDYAAAVRKNERGLEELKSRKTEFGAKIEKFRADKSNLAVEAEKAGALKAGAEKEQKSLEAKLKKLIADAGAETLERCVALKEEFSNFPDAEAALEEYKRQTAAVGARLDELKGTEGIEGVSAQKLEDAEAAKRESGKKLEEINGGIAVLKSRREETAEKLKEKRELLKDYDALIKKRNLLAQLKEVTRNNKFLEYIADEYLVDISSAASKTLLRLTDGRYFLTYKDNNFFIGDNFDCGNLRGVNTLSGGETFLVSLSLALALSQTICSRSMKSIEFFFLDEGFGTLDSALVDTVMDALVKLKSSHFTIGVISHVEELKNRIDSKITVKKATETHGSCVQVSL